MLIESLTKQYIELQNNIKDGTYDTQGLDEAQVKVTTILRYLDSEVITSLLKAKYGKDYPTPLDNYVVIYGEDVNGNVLLGEDIIKTGEEREHSLIGSKYIYIPENTQTLLVEVKFNTLKVRIMINGQEYVDGNGQPLVSKSRIYFIHLPVGGNPLLVEEPLIVDTDKLLGNYIYPVIKEDGTLSLGRLVVE